MRLRELREDKNLSQEELAKAIGTSQTNIGRWEKGLNEPSYRYVVLLADFFGVTTDYLLGREDDFGNVSVKNNADLTDDEKLILETYRNLPIQRRKTFMLFVQSCNENDVGKTTKYHA